MAPKAIVSAWCVAPPEDVPEMPFAVAMETAVTVPVGHEPTLHVPELMDGHPVNAEVSSPVPPFLDVTTLTAALRISAAATIRYGFNLFIFASILHISPEVRNSVICRDAHARVPDPIVCYSRPDSRRAGV